MQRGYSRDYYDVWRLLKEDKFKDSEIKKLLKRKCKLNRIKYEPSLLFDEKRLSEAQSFWQIGLPDSLRTMFFLFHLCRSAKL
jgi:predicted nucleotidyltransferase component of viral defense system